MFNFDRPFLNSLSNGKCKFVGSVPVQLCNVSEPTTYDVMRGGVASDGKVYKPKVYASVLDAGKDLIRAANYGSEEALRGLDTLFDYLESKGFENELIELSAWIHTDDAAVYPWEEAL